MVLFFVSQRTHVLLENLPKNQVTFTKALETIPQVASL